MRGQCSRSRPPWRPWPTSSGTSNKTWSYQLGIRRPLYQSRGTPSHGTRSRLKPAQALAIFAVAIWTRPWSNHYSRPSGHEIEGGLLLDVENTTVSIFKTAYPAKLDTSCGFLLVPTAWGTIETMEIGRHLVARFIITANSTNRPSYWGL